MSGGGTRDLTRGSVILHLVELAAPMVVGILAIQSISLADTLFVGQLGTTELAALSFTFPIAIAASTFSLGLSAGTGSVVSRALGGDERGRARCYAGDGLLLATALVVALSVAGRLLTRPLFALIGAEGETLEHVVDYMHIWWWSMPFLVVSMVANAIVRSDGDSRWPSAIMVGSALVNILLTWMLVFGILFPPLGIEGAAIATLAARALGFAGSIALVVRGRGLVSLSPPPPSRLLSSAREIGAIALPAAAGRMVTPLAVTFATSLLAVHGDRVVAGFGVATRVQAFAMIPMFALSSAVGPFSGQNWGAGEHARVREALVKGYVALGLWSLVAAIALQFLAEPIAAPFAEERAVVDEATRYLAIVPWTLWGYGSVIVAASAFSALDRPSIGLAYHALHAVALYVPLVWIGSRFDDPQAVFIGIAAANALGGAIAIGHSLRWLSHALEPEGDGASESGDRRECVDQDWPTRAACE